MFLLNSLLLLTFSLHLACGLFHKGVPKKGEFCYVLAKPPLCLFVDFENKKLFMNEKEYDLTLRTRVEYLFDLDGIPAELWATTENRVEIKIPGEKVPKFYMRKKEKFSSFPESKK